MRTAASKWDREYSGTLVDAGFAVGQVTSCAFYHPGRDVRIVVHGDDFVACGRGRRLGVGKGRAGSEIHREGARGLEP